MIEVMFLILLGLVWIVFASVQDLRMREVANWANFSLIVFALGFRFFWSLFNGSFDFFYFGLMGLGIFFVLGNLFYYGRLFAGGDAKLLIALGPILGFSLIFRENVLIYFKFVFVFLLVGALYGLIWSFCLVLNNFKVFRKDFVSQFRKKRLLFWSIWFLSVVSMFFGILDFFLLLLGVLLFFFPLLYIYAKVVDRSFMIKTLPGKDLREGDWLYKDVKIGNQTIKANWEGISLKELNLLKKLKSVKIREGIPFVPVFLISYILLLFIWKEPFF